MQAGSRQHRQAPQAGPARRVRLLACVLGFGWALLLPASIYAQQASPETAKTKDHAAPSSGKAAPAKPAADENAFPEDISRRAAAQDHSAAPPAQAATPADGQQTAKPAADADNPFPEDVSRKAAEKAASGDSSSSADSPDSSSSSSSSSASSANPGSPDADADVPPDVPANSGRKRRKKPSDKDIQSGSLAGTGRAEEDVRIGRYYLSQHNYQGAYGRFQEAARMDPANVEAIYGTAASAEGLHKRDEALENYKLYLQIAPDGEHAKAVEKSLKALSH